VSVCAAPPFLFTANGEWLPETEDRHMNERTKAAKYSRLLLLAAVLLSIASAQAIALPPCYSDKVINTNGLRIRLGSGQIFNGYPGTGHLTSMWLPLDKVTVCYLGGGAVKITNTSRKNQTIKALRIYN
jgi:hypothetical protein